MDEKPNLRWGVERKLEFIEFRLFWEGYVNRADIIETFNVSVNQASTDLNRYLGLAPDNMSYDKSARTYVRTSMFKPLFLKPDVNLYLSQVRSLSDGLLDKNEAWIGNVPDFGSIPFPARGVLPAVLRTIVIAIRRHEAVEICYQSMSSPEPQWRWIVPHALAFDGFRWHARAFCEQSGLFKDFVLSRIAETKQTRSSDVQAANDADWHHFVDLEVGPHPALSDGQRRAFELDYGMSDGRVSIPVRRALLYYALKRLGLDTDPAARRPQDQQIILLNSDQVVPLHGNGAIS